MEDNLHDSIKHKEGIIYAYLVICNHFGFTMRNFLKKISKKEKIQLNNSYEKNMKFTNMTFILVLAIWVIFFKSPE